LETRRLHLRDKFGHPDIVMSVDGKPGSDWLINYFSEQAHDGVCFKAGQTVQVGWALVKLVGDGSDGLTVFEPDFSSMPVEWVAGTSRVMRQLIVQREVCDQIGAAPCFPSMIEPGAVSPGFIGGRSAFTMSRDENGWLFRSKDDKGHEAGLSSLYAVGIGRTAVVPSSHYHGTPR
jgi:hypothetical protein